ncbi:MAG: hypothetical protein M3Q87_10840, partial [Actinomycetota bacterium]|nr:hypothetical protein [Actinomycetota bacterium]
MNNSVLLVLGLYLVTAVMVVTLLRAVGRGERVLTPIALFIGIEVFAVWPALLPESGSVLASVGPFPAILAAVSLLAAVVTYLVFGGASADCTRWRGSGLIPDQPQ